MHTERAPLFTGVRPGPEDGQAFFLTASDGLRLRAGIWGVSRARKGTILCFPGRTEYLEKYGDFANAFTARGYAVAALDWRGQGLADRLLLDRRVGDVEKFTDYQKDVGAYLQFAKAQNLPKPWFILGHSMGGSIGLRSVMEGLDVAGIAFSAPMWGIGLPTILRPIVLLATRIMGAIGRDDASPPGRKPVHYANAAPFENNMLTRDPDMYRMIQDQLAAHPDLSLGGPSYRWLREAMNECSCLAKRPLPNTPCLTLLGSNERIVDSDQIKQIMARWSGARLEILADGEHEVLLEKPELREPAFDLIDAHFSACR